MDIQSITNMVFDFHIQNCSFKTVYDLINLEFDDDNDKIKAFCVWGSYIKMQISDEIICQIFNLLRGREIYETAEDLLCLFDLKNLRLKRIWNRKNKLINEITYTKDFSVLDAIDCIIKDKEINIDEKKLLAFFIGIDCLETYRRQNEKTSF